MDLEKCSIVVSQMSKLFILTTFATLHFLQVRIGFFSKTVRPRNIKFGVNNHLSIIILHKDVLYDERIRKKIAL